MEKKICIKCNFVKPLDDFPKRKESKDGRRGHCTSCEKIRKKEYRLKYPNANKEYIFKNITKHREYRKHSEKRKRTNDYLYKLKHNLRVRTCEYFKQKGFQKKSETFKIIGCSLEFLKEHLEKQFKEGMSWDLMGQYLHIDHIIPLSSAKTEEELYKLCHYTNLQPLWAIENIKKGNKILRK